MAEIGVGPESDLANPQKFYVNVSVTLRSIQYETRDSGYGRSTRLSDSVDEQYGPSSAFVDTPADEFLIAFKVFETLVQSLVRGEAVANHEETLNSVLAVCLRRALRANSANCKTLLETLANASRFRKSRLNPPCLGSSADL
jgi:hypothetical protein